MKSGTPLPLGWIAWTINGVRTYTNGALTLNVPATGTGMVTLHLIHEVYIVESVRDVLTTDPHAFLSALASVTPQEIHNALVLGVAPEVPWQS